MPRPVMLGIVGDSGSGKTTITRGLVRVLGEQIAVARAELLQQARRALDVGEEHRHRPGGHRPG